jgi:hypothetical protein
MRNTWESWCTFFIHEESDYDNFIQDEKGFTESLGQWGHKTEHIENHPMASFHPWRDMSDYDNFIQVPKWITESLSQWCRYLVLTSKSLMQRRRSKVTAYKLLFDDQSECRLINCYLMNNQSVGILIPLGYGLFGFGETGESPVGWGGGQILRSNMQRILDSWIWRL